MGSPTRLADSGVSISSACVSRSSLLGKSRAPLVAAIVLAAAGGVTGSERVPRSWREGPVRFLLSEDQRRAFGRLEGETERAAFVERFWRELDPDPATERNEFRETFESRCAIASERFESVSGPAWSSDRGRVYILLGEPREIRRETSGLHAVEKEVWTYATTDGAAGTEIAFFRCPDGGYRLDRNCPAVALSSASSDWYRSNSLRWGLYGAPTPTRGQIRDVISSIVAPAASSRPAEDHPAPTGTSSPAPAAEAAAPEAATKEVAYYFRAEDGSILTLLAVEVVEPGEGLVVGVTLEEHPERPREGVSAHRARTLLLEPAPPPAGPGTYFAKTYLNGGSSYGARFAVKDGRRDQILVRDRRLEVPDLSGFAASSIVPAERFGPASAGADGRFVVGSEEVLPRPSGEFRRGELLRLYLQVYGAAIDPATSMPRVDVSFRFHTDAKARPRSLRSPLKLTGATGASMGLALPIGDWPEGAYRVDVDLKDRVGGVSASVSGTFRIAAR